MLFYFSLWDREWYFLGFRRKFLDEVVKIAFFVPIKTLQVFLSKKYYSFWPFLYIERFFWTLCWKFSDELVKTASYPFIGSSCWEKHFDEKSLMLFNQFETFSEKVLAVCRDFFVGLLQFQSTCSKNFILRKKICLKISFFHHLGQRSKKYRTSSKHFRRSSQNFILRVHKNNMTKTAFFLGKI